MRKHLGIWFLSIFCAAPTSYAASAKRVIDVSLCAKKSSITRQVISVLNEYSDQLSRTGKQSRSSQVRQYAERLSAGSQGVSSYMGFNPQQVLESYSTSLRKAGQLQKAGEVRALGRQMFDSNLACYYLQRTQRQQP